LENLDLDGRVTLKWDVGYSKNCAAWSYLVNN